jgi:hypothetical protein
MTRDKTTQILKPKLRLNRAYLPFYTNQMEGIEASAAALQKLRQMRPDTLVLFTPDVGGGWNNLLEPVRLLQQEDPQLNITFMIHYLPQDPSNRVLEGDLR